MKADEKRIQRDIEELAKFSATPERGVTRFSFSNEDLGARNYLKEEMKKAGLRVYEDAAGTVIGRLDGEIKDGPVVMIGSHYDSVKNGGRFDGNAGVVTALEIARMISENDLKLKYPVEFIGMIEEEGGRFGEALFGSRAMAGKVSREQMENDKDSDGISMAQAMKDFGFNPDNIKEAIRKPEQIKAFLELHIEQGPILENERKEIGIVECIVGLIQLEIIVKGRPDHAGTTPMNARADALSAVLPLMTEIGAMAKEMTDGTVATIGVVEVLPGASNIVPGQARFTADIRSKNPASIEKMVSFIKESVKDMEKKGEVTCIVNNLVNVAPVNLDEEIRRLFHRNCDNFGLTAIDMLSGAGHDAMVMAEFTKVGLLFVPSKGGRSHCPEEWTDYRDLKKGIEVMYSTLLNLAEVI